MVVVSQMLPVGVISAKLLVVNVLAPTTVFAVQAVATPAAVSSRLRISRLNAG